MKRTVRTVLVIITEETRDYPSSRPMKAAPVVVETTGHESPGLAKTEAPASRKAAS